MTLTLIAVDDLFDECRWVPGDRGPDVLAIEGVLHTFLLHAGRVDAVRVKIGALLAELPEQFQDTIGGGWSFLQACTDRHGRQWTGLHLHVERLVCLGIAAGLVRWSAPREFWPSLPGGMPYLTVLAARVPPQG